MFFLAKRFANFANVLVGAIPIETGIPVFFVVVRTTVADKCMEDVQTHLRPALESILDNSITFIDFSFYIEMVTLQNFN